MTQSKDKARREKTMIRDRLHILDRMSTSVLNGENESTNDFSDAKSIKNKRKSKIHNPYMLDAKPPKNNKIVLNLKDKLNPQIGRNRSLHKHLHTDNAIFMSKGRGSRDLTSDEDLREDFGQYQNLDSNEEDDLDYINQYINNLPNISYSAVKAFKNDAYNFHSAPKERHSLSPSATVSKSTAMMRKTDLKEHKSK